MRDKLEKMLKPKRYRHSLNVSAVAVKMADIFGVDTKKAEIAGLLHDCAKNLDKEESIELCRVYGVLLDSIEVANPSLIHAPLGAVLIRYEFGVGDSDIENAIRYHTVGRAGMSELEKIIYIADMIEPSRSFDGIEKLRKTAYEDLNRAMFEGLRFSLEFNIKRGVKIHGNSIEAWNDLLMKYPRLSK